MAPADADLVLQVFGDVLQSTISEIPFAGVIVGSVFGILWGKLKSSPQTPDVTAQMTTMINQVMKYVDEQLQYAKEQIVNDAMASFTSMANDLKLQLASLPESAQVVISTHHDCVNKARDALHVLYDLEWGRITLHNYAIMASLYLTLLDDGIKDNDHWGIPKSLKDTYLDRRDRFFNDEEFSKLLAYSMDKAGQGNIPLRKLTISTTQLTNFWYCFSPKYYPLGIPELLAPPVNDGQRSNKTRHVYLQPSTEKNKCVVNNMPGGYVRQVSASRSESTTWHPYYPGHAASVLRLVDPKGEYPKTVHVRYYRLADVVASKFIGLDHEVKVSFSNGSAGSVDAAIPGEGAWKGKLIFDTQAVVLSTTQSNIFTRGQGNAAKLEYVELGSLKLDRACDVRVEWKPTASQARSLVLLSALEFLLV